MTGPEAQRSPLGFNKPCELEDFGDHDLVGAMEEVVEAKERCRQGWPAGREYRKHWEMGMVLLAVKRFLDPERRGFALGVGAGTEATSFCLTNYFDRVFATDLYAGEGWGLNSPPAMLRDPAAFAGDINCRMERLVVQHMDARQLGYEDGTFDLVYSCGAIEHFGRPEEIRQAARQIGRVLRPGGIAAIATEFSVAGPAGYLGHDTLLFDPDAIADLIIEPSGCEPVTEPEFTVSESTRARRVPFSEALGDLSRTGDGSPPEWSRYPHILLEEGARQWTSYQVTVQKPG